MLKKISLFLMLITCSASLFAQKERDYQKAVDSLSAIKDTVVLNKKLAALKEGNESDLTLLLNYNVAKELPYQPLLELIEKRFPKGDIAYSRQIDRLVTEKDLQKKLQMLEALKKQFPNRDMGYAYAMISHAFANAGKFDKSMEYLYKTKGYYRLTAWAMFAYVTNPVSVAKVEQLVDKELKNTKTMTLEQQNLMLSLKRYFFEKKGDFKQAAVVSKKIIDLKKGKDQKENDHYTVLLAKSGQYKQAFPALEAAIMQGTEDEEIRDGYRMAYQSLYPNRNYKAHLDSINKRLQEKYENTYNSNIAQKLVKTKAPEFELLDVNGNKVNLETFKGKTMVIDFWATWCGPCKAALPGMQQLVNKYKGDTTIKFLFIHTNELPGETPKVKENAMAYFKSKQYDLPLYLDLRKGEKGNEVAKAFKVTGIPHKVIVDGNGFIRFTSVGFSGSTPELIAEMSAAIEEIKKSN
ncbi:TlpA family protein disulfide reductase [Mucilaginibacter sp. RS28]|uniref:TlpA family protein disulfide reductase n=1 Tax=Mucilaginibacter straminoryzae TaxID=2932774 RepID=A0A9X2BAV7_9SPHI|nr:TlpA disulfide reductase family protein [Mucilaginibacter straminoryzae]MCJ8209207.1 TlpA family protein disulfide reductase [Mucilaginibacter straminoryzae]